MARTKTLSEIRDDVVVQADLVSVGASTFITQAKLTDWVVNSAHKLAAMLNGPGGDRYLEATTDLSVVSGTAQYALPSDFFQLYSATVILDGHSFPIYPATAEEMAVGEETSHGTYRPRYRLVGSQFEVVPEPNRDMTIKLRYCPNLVTSFAADVDTFDGVMAWEEWIVYDVCVRVAIKQEMDATGFMLLRQDIEKQIARHASERDRGPKHVRDTYDREAYGYYEDFW